jgi:hypothetical protein
MIRSWLGIFVAVLTCVGCGGEGGAKLAGGKQGAAQALAAASSPAWMVNASAGQNGGTATYQCQKGGSVAVTFTVATPDSMSFAADYNDCSTDGRSRLNGTLSTTTTFEASSTSTVLALHMIGELTISGAISDFLRVDVTERVSFSSDSASSTPSVATVVLDGWIETSSDRYVYTSETFVVDMNAELPHD